MNRNKPSNLQALTPREREIIDALYKLGEGTVGQVQATLVQKATYSTVRAQLGILERKGYVLHRERYLRYVYIPVLPKQRAAIADLRHILETFFDGSTERLVVTLLSEIPPEELERLLRNIETFQMSRAAEWEQTER